MLTPDPNEIIDLLDGTTAVARYLKIRPPSVAEWRINGIPIDRLIRLAPLLEKRSNGVLTRKTLFPHDWADIWPELAEDPAGCQER
jgi:hypothetical protein